MSSTRLSGWTVVLLAQVLAGCVALPASTGSAPSATYSPSPLASPTAASIPTADRSRALAQLSPVRTLQEAAQECATALGGKTDLVRVKVYEPPKPGQCETCMAPATGQKGEPLDAVALPLVQGSSVWFTSGDATCAYDFDGQEFKPSTILFW